MKNILTTILLMSTIWSFCQCLPQGDNKSKKIQAADLLKNRSYFPDASTAHFVEFDRLETTKDTGLIYIEGYLTYAKISGPESCECHSADPAMRDYHVYVGKKPKDLKKDCIIVEVSRYSRAVNPALIFANIKALTGKIVRVYGYAFSDDEHKSAIGVWRMGIKEVHPVFLILPL